MEIEASWYIVGTQDRTVHPTCNVFVSKTHGLQGPMILTAATFQCCSQPRFVLDVIRDAVKGAAGTSASKRA